MSHKRSMGWGWRSGGAAWTVAIVLTLLVVATSETHAGMVLHVDDDAPPGGDGMSWETAYRFLQDALGAATEGTEIRVAQGLYRPDRDEENPEGTGDRGAVFQLLDGMVLSGGFLGLSAGKGEDPDERDVAAYVTILDGDVLDDDALADAGDDDNSFHVVAGLSAGGATTIDGFLISAGNANGSGNDASGGGMLVTAGSVLIIDCTFRNNTATFGGALYCENSIATIIGSVFEQNHASNVGGAAYVVGGTVEFQACVVRNNESARGGGLSLDGFSRLTDCTFSENCANRDGGGVAAVGPLTLVRCDFVSNVAGACDGIDGDAPGVDRGGGLVLGSGGMTAVDCRFIGNCAENGGGLAATGQVSTVLNLTRCQFLGNSGERGAGAIISRNDAVIANCIFESNTVSVDGGALLLVTSFARVVNCRFFENSAFWGAAVANLGTSGPSFTNCTFFGNQATFGGAIFNDGDAVAEVSNCILWHDAGGEILGNVALVRYSCVEGGYFGIHVIDEDPRFVRPVGGDLHLSPGSPCIDAGHNWAVRMDERDLDGDKDIIELTPFDLDDAPRFADDRATDDTGCGVPVVVDMGVFEFPGDGANPIYLADLDVNGLIGFSDLLILLTAWGTCEDSCCPADLNIDGSISAVDLLILLTNWS